ncbi:hypothetical protein BLOT_010650 [Blomia tropicalis]|nr:hypothetical protein BLOT_010650 [Blomia tropicalis]
MRFNLCTVSERHKPHLNIELKNQLGTEANGTQNKITYKSRLLMSLGKIIFKQKSLGLVQDQIKSFEPIQLQNLSTIKANTRDKMKRKIHTLLNQ